MLNSRTNLILCFQKTFEAGIDVEEMFIREDPDREGHLKVSTFRDIIKWLPLGLLDSEIEFIMQNSVTYTDTGRVNYLMLINNMQFKEAKFAFKLKKSLVKESDENSLRNAMEQENRRSIFESQKVIIESLI